MDNVTEQTSFNSFFEGQYQSVLNFFSLRVQDRDTAEDLTSKTFLSAFRGWPPKGTTLIVQRAWLFKIAHRTLYQFFREKQHNPKILNYEREQSAQIYSFEEPTITHIELQSAI